MNRLKLFRLPLLVAVLISAGFEMLGSAAAAYGSFVFFTFGFMFGWMVRTGKFTDSQRRMAWMMYVLNCCLWITAFALFLRSERVSITPTVHDAGVSHSFSGSSSGFSRIGG